jgi:hypothetical protein
MRFRKLLGKVSLRLQKRFCALIAMRWQIAMTIVITTNPLMLFLCAANAMRGEAQQFLLPQQQAECRHENIASNYRVSASGVEACHWQSRQQG